MKRLFCAVKVPDSEGLIDVINGFQKALEGEEIKWVDPLNLHITLKFFGPTPDKAIPGIISAIQKAAAICPPFSFTVEGCGTFGSSRLPRVIWLGIRNASGITQLYHEVNNQLKHLDYHPDKDIFTPHLTIGRIKNLSSTYELNTVEAEYLTEMFSEVQVSRFYLIESILRPAGPEYRVVEAFDLGAGHRA